MINKIVVVLVFAMFSDFISKYAGEAIMQMTPFLIATIPLILADLKFGTKAAKFRGETVRSSSVIRRTINKVVEYICWVVLAVTLDKAFSGIDHNEICYTILAIVYLVELHSCYNNYLEPKGKSLKIDFREIFGGKFKGVSIVDKKPKADEKED